MDIKRKTHLGHVIIFLIMLLFAMGLTINVLFCSDYNLYESLNKADAIETWTVSEHIVATEDCDNTPYLTAFSLDKNISHAKAITKNLCPFPMVIPKGFILLLFGNIILLFFYLTLFASLPDERTLINTKIRLDI